MFGVLMGRIHADRTSAVGVGNRMATGRHVFGCGDGHDGEDGAKGAMERRFHVPPRMDDEIQAKRIGYGNKSTRVHV